MTPTATVDIRDIVVSNNSFGPREIAQVTQAISDDYQHFGVLRDYRDASRRSRQSQREKRIQRDRPESRKGRETRNPGVTMRLLPFFRSPVGNVVLLCVFVGLGGLMVFSSNARERSQDAQMTTVATVSRRTATSG